MTVRGTDHSAFYRVERLEPSTEPGLQAEHATTLPPRFLMRPRSALLIGCGLAGAVACVPPRADPAPGTPPAPDVMVPRRTLERWSLERQPGTARYTIRNSATIALAGDTVPADSLATTMIVSLALIDSAGVLAVWGTIDSLHLERGSRVITTNTTPPLPIALHAVLDRQGGLLDLSSPAVPVDSLVVTTPITRPDSLCTATMDPLIATTQELFVRLPRRLTTGLTWQDTTETTSCRGHMPVTTTSISTYTVRGESPGGRIALSRETAITITGGGVQHGRPASVQGSGTGLGTLLIDPENAALTEGHGQSTVMITFEAGMLRQTFTQQGRQEIRLR